MADRPGCRVERVEEAVGPVHARIERARRAWMLAYACCGATSSARNDACGVTTSSVAQPWHWDSPWFGWLALAPVGTR